MYQARVTTGAKTLMVFGMFKEQQRGPCLWNSWLGGTVGEVREARGRRELQVRQGFRSHWKVVFHWRK